MEKLLVVPDSHWPYVDKKAWSIMLKAGAVLKPDRVIVLGDFIDCAPISFHSKDPTRIMRFSEELKAAHRGLDDLESLKAKKYTFIEGNHEYRLLRYLQEKAPELIDILDIKTLLGIESRGWEWVPYKHDVQVGKMYFTHDVEASGATAHVKLLNDYQGNAGIGHTHQMAVQYGGNVKGTSHVGVMFGWLGDKSAIDYRHKAKIKNWQHGFGVGYLEKNGNVHIQAVPIIDGRCVVEGQLVK